MSKYDSVSPCPEYMNMKRAANWAKDRDKYREGYSQIKWHTKEELAAIEAKREAKKQAKIDEEREMKEKFGFHHLKKQAEQFYREETIDMEL